MMRTPSPHRSGGTLVLSRVAVLGTLHDAWLEEGVQFGAQQVGSPVRSDLHHGQFALVDQLFQRLAVAVVLPYRLLNRDDVSPVNFWHVVLLSYHFLPLLDFCCLACYNVPVDSTTFRYVAQVPGRSQS